MATDTTKASTTRTKTADTTPTNAIEQQINDLRDQVSRITHFLADRGGDLSGGAQDAARGAVGRVRHEAAGVAEAARENPLATTTVLAGVAAIGFALGYLFASNAVYDQRHRWF